MHGVVHVLDPSGERQHLPLAQELLAQALLELQGFVGQRAGDGGLLDALGVLQLVIAEAQDLAVVEPQGRDADEQQRRPA